MISRKLSISMVATMMWLIWLATLLGIAVLLTFVYQPNPSSDRWIFDFTWLIVLLVFLSIGISIRFLILPRIPNPWFSFTFFIVGVFFAEMITVVGLFALTSGQQSYILTGITTLLLFCPHWIRKGWANDQTSLS